MKNDFTYKATKVFEFNSQNLADLACTAFEGGINYWCDEVVVVGDWPTDMQYASDFPLYGAAVEVHDREEDEWHLVTGDKLAKAIKDFADSELSSHIDDFLNENDDAETADVIFQLAIFGELVYG